MSEIFRSSEDYIERQHGLSDDSAPKTRLILDIADLLTGPTSGGNARYLSERMCRNSTEVVERMREIVERYLATAIEEDNDEVSGPPKRM